MTTYPWTADYINDLQNVIDLQHKALTSLMRDVGRVPILPTAIRQHPAWQEAREALRAHNALGDGPRKPNGRVFRKYGTFADADETRSPFSPDGE